MKKKDAFSAKRISLPCRIQVQSERERLQRREQLISKMMRFFAGGVAAVLLFGTVAVLVFF